MNGKSKENKVWSEKVDFLLDKVRFLLNPGPIQERGTNIEV